MTVDFFPELIKSPTEIGTSYPRVRYPASVHGGNARGETRDSRLVVFPVFRARNLSGSEVPNRID